MLVRVAETWYDDATVMTALLKFTQVRHCNVCVACANSVDVGAESSSSSSSLRTLTLPAVVAVIVALVLASYPRKRSCCYRHNHHHTIPTTPPNHRHLHHHFTAIAAVLSPSLYRYRHLRNSCSTRAKEYSSSSPALTASSCSERPRPSCARTAAGSSRSL